MNTMEQFEKMQDFEWGTLLWFFEPDNLDIERLSVGLVTFKPNMVQNEHLHSGDEQVIYVISGAGLQTVNDATEPIRTGDIKHIPPYARHKVVNLLDTELKLIIVYTPSKFQQLLASPDTELQNDAKNLFGFLDTEALRSLLNKLADATDFSLAVLNTAGEILLTTNNYPRFCTLLSTASGGQHCRQHILPACDSAALSNNRLLFFCCHNIASIVVPIFNGDVPIGFIKCGQIFIKKPDLQQIEREFSDLYSGYGFNPGKLMTEYLSTKIQPKSRLYAAAEATFVIANYINEMATASLRQTELTNSRISLIKEQVAKAELEKALKEADFKLLISQINPHFLFNTLGTIAHLAYIDGSERVANLVWNLSDLLRYTLKKTEQLISLQEELEMVRNYVAIQTARFGERLSVATDIDPALTNVLIPGLLLQPLIENAIIHGIEGSKNRGIVTINVKKLDQDIQVEIIDNGVGFNLASIVNQEKKEKKNGLGIDSVKNRLQYYYGERQSFFIDSKPGKGTRVVLTFPLMHGDDDAKT
ncbi:MAG: histidine kinase [Firmicutes bacterium]|nr:histidine kinase [Bacillota bacterium]